MITANGMHWINLKGPWGFQPLEGESPGVLPAAGTVKFPAAWQSFLGDFRGRTLFTRTFNCPTNLDAHERVNLLLDGVSGRARITLNGEFVGAIDNPSPPVRFDITQRLELHNQLQIEVHWEGAADQPGGLWAPVALEILSNQK